MAHAVVASHSRSSRTPASGQIPATTRPTSHARETRNRVYIVVASGSGLQEAAIRNCVGGRVLCFVNGAFSQRWHDVAVGCDKQVVRVDVEWNTAVKPSIVAEALAAALQAGPVDAITVVHNETSTGVISPVAEIAAPVREISPATFCLLYTSDHADERSR